MCFYLMIGYGIYFNFGDNSIELWYMTVVNVIHGVSYAWYLLVCVANMFDLHPNHKILVHFLGNVSEHLIQVHSICMKM